MAKVNLGFLVLGLLVLGGGTAYLLTREPAPPRREKGFQVVGGCKGLVVTDEMAAYQWALARTTGPLGSRVSPVGIVDATSLLGPACAQLSPEQYVAAFPKHQRFLYGVMQAWLHGFVANSNWTREQARVALAEYRNRLVTAGVSPVELQPLPEQIFG